MDQLDQRKRSLPGRSAVGRRTLFVALTCVLVSLIALLSFLPSSDKSALHTYGRFHFLGHFLIFIVLGFVAARASGARRTRIALVVASMAFGFGIEFAEFLVYGVGLEWYDVFVDWAGVIVGSLVAIYSTQKIAFRVESP